MAHPLQECSLFKGEFLASRLTRSFISAYSCLNLKQVEKIPATAATAATAVTAAATAATAANTWSGPEGTSRQSRAWDPPRGHNFRGNYKRKNHFNDSNFPGKRGFY